MPLYVTQQIVFADHVMYPGTVLREGEKRERALEEQGWGIYCDEEQLHWYVMSDDEYDNCGLVDDDEAEGFEVVNLDDVQTKEED